MALRGRKLQQCYRKAAAGCLSFKEFWGVQFEKGCFLFQLKNEQRLPKAAQKEVEVTTFRTLLEFSWHYVVENAAPNCSSAIEKQQQQAAFLLRSFGASNLKRAAFFFDYKEFLANGGTVGGLLCQQFISSILFVRHKLLMELFPNLRSTVLLLAC